MVNSALTKIPYATKDFDTNTNYDTTLSRFTPTVAGYYQVSATVACSGAAAGGYFQALIYKNGTAWACSTVSSAVGGYVAHVTALVYLNGSTDYVEVYASQSSGGTISNTSSSLYKFQGALVRAA